MSNVINLTKYSEFVAAVTSNPSNDMSAFRDRVVELAENVSDVNISLLITACMGLAAEAGEFIEIPKKILFQGKPLTEDNIIHMKKELGDTIFYWINACRALNIDPNEVIATNVEKLTARYPGGVFDAFYSENRLVGDI